MRIAFVLMSRIIRFFFFVINYYSFLRNCIKNLLLNSFFNSSFFLDIIMISIEFVLKCSVALINNRVC